MKKLILLTLMLPVVVLAQDAAPVEPSLLDKILSALTSAEGAAATIAVVVEFLLRLVPSAKPLSIAHAVASVVRMVGAIATKLADVLDKVLPQKVK